MWQNTHRKNYETMVLLYDYWYGCSTTIHADINLFTRYTIHTYTYVHSADKQHRIPTYTHTFSIRSNT